MDCHPSSVHLGYILPWRVKSGQKPTPKLLNDNDTFDKMMDDVRTWRDEQASKNKGTVKAFTVQLVNLQPDMATQGAKPTAKVSYHIPLQIDLALIHLVDRGESCSHFRC